MRALGFLSVLCIVVAVLRACVVLLRLGARMLVATVVLIVSLILCVVVLLLNERCSSNVVDRTALQGPVTLWLVTLGVELRTGLHNLGLLLLTEVEGTTLSELASVVALLARTLLKRPLASIMLKLCGWVTRHTVTVLISKRLIVMLGHLCVTSVEIALCYRCEALSMPVPLIEISWCRCVCVSVVVAWAMCRTLLIAHVYLLAVWLVAWAWVLKQTLLASLWMMITLAFLMCLCCIGERLSRVGRGPIGCRPVHRLSVC